MNNEKRQKDFAKASAQFDGIHAQVAFVSGCEHGYQYAIDKACEWLRENIYHRVYECGDRLGYPTADFLKDFRKAIEE